MWRNSKVLGGEAKRKRCLETFKRVHLSIKPVDRVRTKAVGPAQSRSQIADIELLEPFHSGIETVVLKMEPLADAQSFGKVRRGQLGRSIFFQQAHVVVPIIRATLRFLVPGGGYPGGGQIIQAVPVNALHFANQ